MTISIADSFDFDTVIDRAGRGSLKWDLYPPDILPMWVADMDFAAPPEVLAALQEAVQHGVFGYATPRESLVQAVVERLRRCYNWIIQPEWIVWLPGLVCGLNACCRGLADPRSDALSAVPIYPPFITAPRCSELNPVTVPTRLQDGRWRLLPEDLAAACTPASQLFLLCNPHNPVGRAYSKDELAAIAEVCLERDLLIISDEIHCDLILDEVPHIPIATLGEDVAQRTVTLMAPSKTYNLAGLGCSFAIVPSAPLRRKLEHAKRGIVPDINLMGLVAAEAAYQHGDAWLGALIDYLRVNRDLVEGFVASQPALSMTHIEATYLAWIDVSQLPTKDAAALFREHGVGLSAGHYFHDKDYVRLNFGCPRRLLQQGLDRLANAISSLS